MARNQNEIRKVSELPQWYSLEKYAGSAQLGFVDWYEQLKARQAVIRLFKFLNAPEVPSEMRQSILEYVNGYLEEIRKSPLQERGSSPLYKNTVETCQIYGRGVRFVTALDFYMTEQAIEKTKRDYIRAWMAEKYNESKIGEGEMRRIESQDWYSLPIDDMITSDVFKYTIRVNPLISDNVLIEEFKELLKDIRKNSADYCSSQKQDISGWAKFSVLPFIDLWMWQSIEDKHITNRVMADAIFPPGEGGEEVVRKTTSKLAFSLLEESHLETLKIRALNEKAERK